ncbi:hypothetical protein F4811DRAFT_557162 [Daldinia bambusicola]|nr:hypothetical protein F4811DRAFT_557162 [Daldinia bambusicola]
MLGHAKETGIQSLLTELLVDIFTVLNSSNDVELLRQTSKTFYNAYSTDTDSRYRVARDKGRITLPIDQNGPGCRCTEEKGTARKQRTSVGIPLEYPGRHKWSLFANFADLQRFYRWCCPTRTDADSMAAEFSSFLRNTQFPEPGSDDINSTADIMRHLPSPKQFNPRHFHPDPEAYAHQCERWENGLFLLTCDNFGPYLLRPEQYYYRYWVLGDRDIVQWLFPPS